MSTGKATGGVTPTPDMMLLNGDRATFLREFQHLRSSWFWFFLLGLVLVTCGTLAIIFPAVTASTSILATVVLGVCLMVAGVATIITSFWAGRWSGLLLQLLVGILYVVVGYEISDQPLKGAAMLTAFIAAMFVVLGFFRIVAALVIRFPYWGWALLNGVVTLLIGVIIYRHFPESALWVIGLLVGIEMLLHGWNWIMLSMAVKNIPEVE
jgi:uncharacterized membrane protein HdeD (DUF308 family)